MQSVEGEPGAFLWVEGRPRGKEGGGWGAVGAAAGVVSARC